MKHVKKIGLLALMAVPLALAGCGGGGGSGPTPPPPSGKGSITIHNVGVQKSSKAS